MNQRDVELDDLTGALGDYIVNSRSADEMVILSQRLGRLRDQAQAQRDSLVTTQQVESSRA